MKVRRNERGRERGQGKEIYLTQSAKQRLKRMDVVVAPVLCPCLMEAAVCI